MWLSLIYHSFVVSFLVYTSNTTERENENKITRNESDPFLIDGSIWEWTWDMSSIWDEMGMKYTTRGKGGWIQWDIINTRGNGFENIHWLACLTISSLFLFTEGPSDWTIKLIGIWYLSVFPRQNPVLLFCLIHSREHVFYFSQSSNCTARRVGFMYLPEGHSKWTTDRQENSENELR